MENAELYFSDRHDHAKPTYRRDVDGLRAIAVISVVLYHAGVFPFRGGFAGVDIFFVISGFLVGGIVFQDVVSNHFSLAAFYARRAKRILPALFAVTVTIEAISLLVLSPSEIIRFAKSVVSALLGAANFWYWLDYDYFSPASRLEPFLMTWSLGVEEQFYLILPPLIFLIHRFRPKAVLPVVAAITSLSLGVSIWATASHPVAAFYLLPARLWELGVGVLLGIWRRNHSEQPHRRREILNLALSWAGLGGLALAIVMFHENMDVPGYAALLPVLSTAALIASEGSWINRHLLSLEPLVGIGLISYSWYLWHWPLMALVRVCAITDPSVGVLSAVALLSLALAYLSWRFIEQPFRKSRLPGSVALPRYAAALVLMLIVPTMIWVADGVPRRFPVEVTEMELEVELGEINPCIVASSTPNLSRACVTSGSGRRVVALIGDSHAGALGPGLAEIASRKNWDFEILTKSSCRALRGVSVWSRKSPDLVSECAAFLEESFNRVSNNEMVQSVILAGMWAAPLFNPEEEHYYDLLTPKSETPGQELLVRGLTLAIRDLERRGKHVFVATDVPYWMRDPVRAAITGSVPMRKQVAMWSRTNEDWESDYGPKGEIGAQVDDLVASSVKRTKATLLPLASTFCDSSGCKYRHHSQLFYLDHSHLTLAGARVALAPWQDLIMPQ